MSFVERGEEIDQSECALSVGGCMCLVENCRHIRAVDVKFVSLSGPDHVDARKHLTTHCDSRCTSECSFIIHTDEFHLFRAGLVATDFANA